MSCGCKSGKENEIIPEALFGESEVEIPVYQLANETTECFMARIGPQPPQPEAGSKAQEEKIATLSIPVDCEMKVDTTFKMVEGSHEVDWELVLKDENGNVVQASDWGLTYDSTTPKLSGQFKKEMEKKKLSAHMKAKVKNGPLELKDENGTVQKTLQNGEVVDEKEYSLVPKKCEPSDLKFIHPNPGSVTGDPFGPRFHPIKHVWKQHAGVDFKSHGKNDIVASADGVVSFCGISGSLTEGYGRCIVIDHKDASGKLFAKTRYAHLSQTYVTVGQSVSAGTKIGHEGATGGVTGPHLHFEILIGGTTPDDPLKYINGTIKIDTDAAVTSSDPNSTPTNVQTVENKNKGLTSEAVTAMTDCQPQPLESEPAAAVDKMPKPGPVLGGSKCKPDNYQYPGAQAIAVQIRDCARAQGASDDDIRYMLKIAYLESTYNPYAANSKSSALGLYQMLDDTAAVWFAKIGVPCTCENRCNVEYATKAMYEMVKYEGKGYSTFKQNRTIAGSAGGQVLDNPYTQGYDNLTREQFMYMSHGQGQEGMRKGTKNGSGFLSHFKSHAPSDSIIDGYMNA